MALLYSLWQLIIFHSVNTHTPHTQCIYTTSSLSIPLVMDISHSLKWGRNFATAALGWSSKWMEVGSKACGKGKRGKTRVRHTSEIWRSSWDNTKSLDMFTFGEHVFFGFLNMEAFKQLESSQFTTSPTTPYDPHPAWATHFRYCRQRLSHPVLTRTGLLLWAGPWIQLCLLLYWAHQSVQFSSSVVSDSLRPHESQHARPTCPSPTPRVYSNPCPLSRWCHPAISSSVVPFSSCLQSFPASGSFPVSELFAWHGQSIGSFSFSISPSNEHPGLISFRMDWLDLLAVQGTLESLLQHIKSINCSVLSFLHSPTLTSIHDHWKNHSLD